jgi:sugar phosphate isomerase/epimerase
MFRLSWTQALFTGETLEASLGRLSRLGYDGVELPLTSMPPATILSRLRHYGLTCTSVNGRFHGADRDLSSPDERLRTLAVDYVRACMRFAADLAAPLVIVVPTRIGKLQPDTCRHEEWDRVVQSLAEIGAFGQEIGVMGVVEPVNRAETYMANRLETACRLVRAAGSDHLGVMGDSFHMNIEESSMTMALEEAAPLLRHIHLADNNRAAPGMGHLDLEGFVGTLDRIGYAGAISMECDVQAPDVWGRMAFVSDPKVFDAYATEAIATLRAIEAAHASRSLSSKGS